MENVLVLSLVKQDDDKDIQSHVKEIQDLHSSGVSEDCEVPQEEDRKPDWLFDFLDCPGKYVTTLFGKGRKGTVLHTASSTQEFRALYGVDKDTNLRGFDAMTVKDIVDLNSMPEGILLEGNYELAEDFITSRRLFTDYSTEPMDNIPLLMSVLKTYYPNYICIVLDGQTL